MTKFLLVMALIAVGLAAATLTVLHFPRAQAAVQDAVVPGKLSQSHAFLENNCAACHTPTKGVEAKNCIVCHAANKAILQRQPSAFHSDIAACAACHNEHQGRVSQTTKMDHAALAHIGVKQLANGSPQNRIDAVSIKRWLEENNGKRQLTNSNLLPEEVLLNCVACHKTKDRHVGLFGTDCAQCHATSKWTIPEFRHPSTASQSCNQCHQAPPSHYMMHFKMISMKIARQPNADVPQCFLCHQTTSWNDIQGVGYYKHH
jgi:hypothetical protein